ncbi:MAG TPA: VOC family protein [Acidimicrobiales bacterium]|nr:VOC family protein [Acidimicrobiales bacterium]
MAGSVELEVGIVTEDLDGLARFLVEGLGFEPGEVRRFEAGAVHRFRRGAARAKVFVPAAPPPGGDAAAAWPDRAGFAYAALLVPDAAAALERAVAAGASVLAPVTAHRPGARMALVRDPQGNVWELLEEAG